MVEGGLVKQKTQLMITQGRTSNILNWTIKALLDPDNKIEERREWFIVRDEGVYISPKMLSDKKVWQTYIDNTPMSPVWIGRAIADATSIKDASRLWCYKTKKRYFMRLIPKDLVVAYAQESTLLEETTEAYDEFMKESESYSVTGGGK